MQEERSKKREEWMTELPPELGKNFGILFYTLTYIVYSQGLSLLQSTVLHASRDLLLPANKILSNVASQSDIVKNFIIFCAPYIQQCHFNFIECNLF